MAPADDPAFHRAMDQLMLQVDTDNVVAAHGAFKQHAENLKAALQGASMEVGQCGTDPVSPAAAKCFNDKITQVVAVHWRHWEELEAVADKLAATARSYGKTDDELRASFTRRAG